MLDNDPSFPILLVGAITTLIWWAGALLAWWRRRYLLTLGLFGAGAAAIVFTLTAADVPVPAAVVVTAAIARTPVAALLVGSFVYHQPKHAGRPQRWSP